MVKRRKSLLWSIARGTGKAVAFLGRGVGKGVKKGVEVSKPLHYAQVQISMALSGMTRALYVALCKDDEQFYVERIKENKTEQKKLLEKITSLTQATLRPAGISDNGSSFGCKFCSVKDVCTRQVEPLRNCRTCSMCSAGPEGKWVCELNNNTLTFDEQRAACEHWEAL